MLSGYKICRNSLGNIEKSPCNLGKIGYNALHWPVDSGACEIRSTNIEILNKFEYQIFTGGNHNGYRNSNPRQPA